MTSEYEVGDVVVFETSTTKQEVRVTEKHSDIKNGRPGFDGEVTKVIRTELASRREEGDLVWGYNNQIRSVVKTEN